MRLVASDKWHFYADGELVDLVMCTYRFESRPNGAGNHAIAQSLTILRCVADELSRGYVIDPKEVELAKHIARVRKL